MSQHILGSANIQAALASAAGRVEEGMEVAASPVKQSQSLASRYDMYNVMKVANEVRMDYTSG